MLWAVATNPNRGAKFMTDKFFKTPARKPGFLFLKQSYGDTGFIKLKEAATKDNLFCRRVDWIRTSDPLHPIQVRYRAAPPPELLQNSIIL